MIDLLKNGQFEWAGAFLPHAVHGANAFEDLAHQGRFGGVGKALVGVPTRQRRKTLAQGVDRLGSRMIGQIAGDGVCRGGQQTFALNLKCRIADA
ncbi:hypothetical protein [Hydrogenophaga sp.]|uniref:hypothetical protein n=1 Tax=Hydrogenophaga sp. TaxID=1904254 RepID=UPI003AF6E730